MIRHTFTKRQILLTIFTILYIGFIFSNSLQNAELSSEKSGSVLKLIREFFDFMGLSVPLTEHFIRKSAHFLEYTGLGVFLVVTLLAYTKQIRHFIFVLLFVGLLIPVADEFLQVFVQGRAGMVQDVVLDFSGVLTGLLVMCILVYMHKKRLLSQTCKGESQ